MMTIDTRRRIDSARDILVGKVPDPKAQVEQITMALIYKFMDDMDEESEELGGKAQFFVNEYEKYSWSKLLDPRLGGFDRLNLYSEALQKMPQNPNLPQLFRNILKDAFLPYRDPETLNLFLKEINEFTYDHSEKLGDAFEYLLSVLGSQGDAGQFRTPRHIIDFIVEVVDPKKDETILDPACGTAGFLISGYKHILKQNTIHRSGDQLTPEEKTKLMQHFVGYDISPDMVKLSLVNMYLHSFPNPNVFEYDTLTSEERWDDTYDVIMANPPFMSPKGGIRPHKRFSIQANRSEVLFVDYIAEHLNTHGRAGVIVPEGIIFQSGNAYKALRKMLIEKYLFAVVSLPSGIFQPYSGVKTSILLMDKQLAKKADSILFVKVENDGFDLGAQRRAIEKNDLTKALYILQKYKQALNENTNVQSMFIDEEESKLAIIVEKEKIAKNGDYNLTGERYKVDIIKLHQKWPYVELGEVCEIQAGGTPSKNIKEYYENGKIPWLRSEVCKNRAVLEATEFITEEGLKNSSAKLFRSKTTLVALVGATIGKTAFLTFEAATNQNIAGLYPLETDKLLPEFLYCIVQSLYDNFVSLGDGNFKMANLSFVRSLKIPLPSIEIQQEIVAEVDNYQKIIDGAKQVAENYKPTINIDPNWEMIDFNKVCTLEYGNSLPKEKRIVGKYPVVGANGITGWHNMYLIEGPSIIIGRKGSAGEVVWIDNHCFPIDTTYYVKLVKDKKIDFKFLYFVLKDLRLTELRGGGAIPGLNRNDVYTFKKIPLPPLEIQKQIVAQIEEEQKLVDATKKLTEIFEQKIKVKIADVWGANITPNNDNNALSNGSFKQAQPVKDEIEQAELGLG